MEYADTNPEHRMFIEELRSMPHFNNLHLHLPEDHYRENYERSKSRGDNPPSFTRCVPLWQAMDEFIAQTNFDFRECQRDFNEGSADPRFREKSQLALCPLYVFLRVKGFSKDELCR